MLNQPIHNCCMISRRRKEPMMGSVKQVTTWFLLQYEGAMGAHALEESDIPADVKEHLKGIVETTPNSRLLLVKSRSGGAGDKLRFMIVNSLEIDPYYVEFELDGYGELKHLDLPDLSSGTENISGLVRYEPFYLVCTNGRRDPCCAQNGLPAFNAFCEHAEVITWQSSHVGGHRFAANVLAFPQGIYYGRVLSDDVDRLINAGNSGQILIGNYRGRACYPKIVQAAEAHLRSKTGKLGFQEYSLESQESLGEQRWRVTFDEPRGDGVYVLDLETRRSEGVDYVSCRDDKQSPVVEYKLTSYKERSVAT
jgi:hypothetical protein